jgi:type VI secretion system protein ImpA
MSEKEEERAAETGEPGATADSAEANMVPLALDIESLLAPISEASPVGESLRYEGTYDRIQEERREDDPALPQGIWERDLKRANWSHVEASCLDAIEKQSKDLQIAAWAMEALLHQHGFEGVHEGLKLIIGMVEQYWDTMYPEIDDGDLDGRLAPFVWINEKLSIQLKLIPVTMPRSMESQPYSLADWENANLLEQRAVKDKHVIEKAEAQGKPTRAKFLGSVMFTPGKFYVRQTKNLAGCLALVKRLNSEMDARCGKDGPSLSIFRQTMENVLSLLNTFLKEKHPEMPETPVGGDEGGAEGAETADTEVQTLGSLSIRSREEAYALMAAAADYLLIHEPHSPTPHLVKRAVRWGRMSLTELLKELISDDSNLRQIFKLLGIRIDTGPAASDRSKK